MKYYNYSVKDMLASHFGENTIFEMRKPHDSMFGSEAEKNLLPLMWQFADQQAVSTCLEEVFLLDTVLEDDYIAYIVQFGNKKTVYLMFMIPTEGPFFHLDVDYAKQIVGLWEERGFSAAILRVCVYVSYYGVDKKNGFRLSSSNCPGQNDALFEIREVNKKSILALCMHPCWEHYYQKLVFLSGTNNPQEHECVFEPDVLITEGKDKEKKTLNSGITAAMDLLNAAPVSIGYSEFKDTETYSCVLISGNKELIITVNSRNLICEINVGNYSGSLIVDAADNSSGSLLDAIPKLNAVRCLDPAKMHGYTLQLEYSNGAVRNYYLKSFDEPVVPLLCEVEEYDFSTEIFLSAKADSEGNISFENGFLVPRHYLYYRSYRQVNIEYDDTIIYQNDEISIRSIYRLPLKEFKSHFTVRYYRGWPEECFGPSMPWTDKNGKRTSDIAVCSIDDGYYKKGAPRVRVESSWKFGFLNRDGSWLAPPVYDTAEEFSESCAYGTRKVNGEAKSFLITENGTEIPFDYSIDIECFNHDRCPFTAEEWNGDRPDAGYYYDFDDVRPGKWGFVDSKGSIIVEPKYVYAIGFYNGGGEHSVVARFVDGKLRWGVIDLDGNEVIPCAYPELYCGYDSESVVFQAEEDGLYGLMDFDGRIIAEPQFGYIKEYDKEHRLITAGNYRDEVGVYSVDQRKMIIPVEFDCVDYDDHMISCESISGKERYFNYDGKEMFFDEYDYVYEIDGLLHVRKDGKVGMIDWDKKVLIPPVLENGLDFHLDYYKKGYLITGLTKLKGLKKTSGETILPEVYSDLSLHENYVVASMRTETNWCVKDTLFLLDGTPLMEGPYRHIYLGENGSLTAETPQGLIHYRISSKAAQKAHE